MTIATHRIGTGYGDAVYSFIKHEEALVRRVYSDPIGIPTLGVGYALITRAPAGSDSHFQIRDTLTSDLAALGITWVQGSPDDILLHTLLDNLNSGKGLANIGTGLNQVFRAIIESDIDGNPIESSLNSAGLNEFNIPILDNAQVRQLFDISIGDIRTQILNGFASNLARLAKTDSSITDPVAAADALFENLDGSNEMMALSSLAFTLPSLIGPKLTAALWHGDRAEAWFEIRYDSNADGKHAARRFLEADTLGLYNSGMTDEDALGAFRTCTRHKAVIDEYEARYAGDLGTAANSGTQLGVLVQPIAADLQPARDYLTSHYALGTTIDGAIRVGEHNGEVFPNFVGPADFADTRYYRKSISGKNISGADDDVLTDTNNNDLIFGESGNDTLVSRAGNDVLYHAGGRRHRRLGVGR